MSTTIKYPIGEQDFKSLREGNFIYIDKTRYIEKMIEGSKYYFLARPRRFGKSLFLSTLRYFFEGRRELFKGLYIDTVNWDWKAYPVLYLDLNREKYVTSDKLSVVLDKLFRSWEKVYDVDVHDRNYAQRFETIIEAAHEKTGRQVVILVDEYDKPLVSNINSDENFEHYRTELASIYSNFKSSAEHIRFVFLTGVSRFSKLSVFSDLNNLNDITFDNEYSDICGITEKEMLESLTDGIENFSKAADISYEEVLASLKANYDGYRFTKSGSDIYNPWSLLCCLSKKEINNYWNETGQPSLVAETLKRINANLEKIIDSYCTIEDLQGLDLLNPNPTALMYQTGYTTIKEYVSSIDQYRLGVPNREVKRGFFRDLLPYYQRSMSAAPNRNLNTIIRGLKFGEPDIAMKALQTYFAGIDYSLKIENENNFHNAFYLLMDLIGLDTKAESHTSDGRIDIEIKTDKYIYIIELKYDHTAYEALEQIEHKRYGRKYHTDKRKIFLIGVAFSSVTRCIEDWKIREANSNC